MTLSRNLLTRIFEALDAEVERTSLRAVARELSMSATGLRKFLDGTRPHGATIHRALGWYLRGAARASGADAELATAALTLLVGPAARVVPDLGPRLLNLLDQSYRAAGLEVPDWVDVALLAVRQSMETNPAVLMGRPPETLRQLPSDPEAIGLILGRSGA